MEPNKFTNRSAKMPGAWWRLGVLVGIETGDRAGGCSGPGGLGQVPGAVEMGMGDCGLAREGGVFRVMMHTDFFLRTFALSGLEVLGQAAWSGTFDLGGGRVWVWVG